MISNLPEEEWKEMQCEGFDPAGKYFISNFGRVKSYASKPEGRILKTHNIDGYEAITLRMSSGKASMRYIHKLVAINFITKDNEVQSFVIHKDFDKSNNRVPNLAWADKKQLDKHLKVNPNKKVRFGHRHYSKLKETDVIRLKKKLFDPDRKTRLKLLAKEFGISEMQLYRIKRGENWASVGINPTSMSA